MKYRIVKRCFSDGFYYYMVQKKWLFLPWQDVDGYGEYYYLDIESARERIERLQVKKLKDIIVE